MTKQKLIDCDLYLIRTKKEPQKEYLARYYEYFDDHSKLKKCFVLEECHTSYDLSDIHTFIHAE